MSYTIKTQHITRTLSRPCRCEPSTSSALKPSRRWQLLCACVPAERELVWREGRRAGRWTCRAVLLTVAVAPAPVKVRNAERVQRASRRDLVLPQLSDVIERPRLTY